MTKVAGTGTFTFAATSGTKTINTAGVTFDNPFTFNGVGGTFQLQAALTSGSTRACTLTNGTLDLNGYTLTTGTFSSTNSNVRTLAFGSTGKIVLTATSGTIFTYGTATNLTVTGTSLVQATSGGAGTRTLTFATSGGTEANSINFEVTAGSDIVSLGGTGGVAQNLNFTGFTGTIDIPNAKTIYGNLDAGSATSITGTSTVTFAATSGTKTIRTNALTYGGSFTFNGIGGTWEMQDALTLTTTLTMTNGTLKLKSGTTSTVGAFATSGTNPKYLYATTFGSQATISDASGTNTVEYLTIQDSNATGGAIFDALAITNVDAGNNTGWLFSTTPSIGNEITMRLRSFTQPRRF
jgi:fibronectin-binding autotransporter adhesin